MDDFSEAKSCCLAIPHFPQVLFSSVQTQNPTIFEGHFLLTKCYLMTPYCEFYFYIDNISFKTQKKYKNLK